MEEIKCILNKFEHLGHFLWFLCSAKKHIRSVVAIVQSRYLLWLKGLNCETAESKTFADQLNEQQDTGSVSKGWVWLCTSVAAWNQFPRQGKLARLVKGLRSSPEGRLTGWAQADVETLLSCRHGRGIRVNISVSVKLPAKSFASLHGHFFFLFQRGLKQTTLSRAARRKC